MRRACRTARLLVIHLLALSLSVVALFPQCGLAGGMRGVAVSRDAGKACCCPTLQGRCGMACCSAQPPKPAQEQSAPKSTSANRIDLTVACHAACLADGSGIDQRLAANSHRCASPWGQTLQAEHVRLQV